MTGEVFESDFGVGGFWSFLFYFLVLVIYSGSFFFLSTSQNQTDFNISYELAFFYSPLGLGGEEDDDERR
jgi:hypothetical protein